MDIPEIVEKILSHLNRDELLRARVVNNCFRKEANKILKKRHCNTILWCKNNFIGKNNKYWRKEKRNRFCDLKLDTLRFTTAPFLYENCKITNIGALFHLSKHIIPKFGYLVCTLCIQLKDNCWVRYNRTCATPEVSIVLQKCLADFPFLENLTLSTFESTWFHGPDFSMPLGYCLIDYISHPPIKKLTLTDSFLMDYQLFSQWIILSPRLEQINLLVNANYRDITFHEYMVELVEDYIQIFRKYTKTFVQTPKCIQKTTRITLGNRVRDKFVEPQENSRLETQHFNFTFCKHDYC